MSVHGRAISSEVSTDAAEPIVYVSVQRGNGRKLVIDGPLRLLTDLVDALRLVAHRRGDYGDVAAELEEVSS